MRNEFPKRYTGPRARSADRKKDVSFYIKKGIFCASGISFLLFAAGAESILSVFGLVRFALIGLAIIGVMGVSSYA